MDKHTCHSLRLGLDNITTNDCFVMNGDLHYNYLRLNSLKGKESSLCCTELGSDSNFKKKDIAVTCDEENYVTNLSFGGLDKWAKIWYLNARDTSVTSVALMSKTYDKWYLFELLNDLTQDLGIKFVCRPAVKSIFEINTVDDLRSVNRLYK